MTNRQWNKFTKGLGSLYKRHEKAKKDLEKKKGAFHDKATAQVAATETLARRAVAFPAEEFADEAEARSVVEQYNPAWDIISLELHENVEPPEYQVVLEEKPEFRPFVWVNAEDEQTYQKNIRGGAPQIDLDRLKEREPDLWIEVSEPDPVELAAGLIGYLLEVVRDYDKERAEDLEENHPTIGKALEWYPTEEETRTLIPPDDLPDELQARVQKYIYTGPPTIAFLKPREATVEELESLND